MNLALVKPAASIVRLLLRQVPQCGICAFQAHYLGCGELERALADAKRAGGRRIELDRLAGRERWHAVQRNGCALCPRPGVHKRRHSGCQRSNDDVATPNSGLWPCARVAIP
jgi:hypothetical protein